MQGSQLYIDIDVGRVSLNGPIIVNHGGFISTVFQGHINFFERFGYCIMSRYHGFRIDQITFKHRGVITASKEGKKTTGGKEYKESTDQNKTILVKKIHSTPPSVITMTYFRVIGFSAS